MKFILVFVFVFSFHVLTLLAKDIPHQDDSSKVLASNPESYLSVNYRFDPQNRRLPKVRWTKVNTRPVCFGTRKNQFGRFYVRRGRLIALKLVHRYGSVTCNINNVNSTLSNWGCGGTEVNVVVTNSRNAVLLPPRKFLSEDKFRARLKWSVIPGYNSFSPRLVLRFFPSPFPVLRSRELRLWYGEDLMDFAEEDNRGSSCVDVFAQFMHEEAPLPPFLRGNIV